MGSQWAPAARASLQQVRQDDNCEKSFPNRAHRKVPSQGFTFGVPKDAVETKDLSYKDPESDEELGYYPDSTSQIFGGHFSKEHGNHIGSQT